MFRKQRLSLFTTMNLDGHAKRRGNVVGETSKTKKATVKFTADSKEITVFSGL